MRHPVDQLPDGAVSFGAARLAEGLRGAETVKIGDEPVVLNDEARASLIAVLDLLASGQRVEVSPVVETLTTQQAATLLNVSRPTLVKLLESGLIPYEQPGVHRRISRAAVEAFSASRATRRQAGLGALAEAFDPEVADAYVTTR